ncbi:MAG TPA: serine/threonine-protein kinase, partial [Gemmatimonadales bacterium]|nr:serine/threonine-protein kinase [Gemmatimonadales bacterium]
MYCSRCGTQNKDTAKFCDACGLDLTATTPTGATTEPREITEIDMVRQELDKEYEILEELGRGGMAIVFKAKERELEREVAIKVLPFSLAFDKEFVERFQREARTSAKLEHPNIIPIYRVGKSGRVIYFVMKFLRGKPLSSVLASRGSLPPHEIKRILADVGRALAYAHKKEIVHRDIKPDNIMFDEHGHAVVTDFGIAKAASGGKLTGTGMSIGTPHYMSPEQAKAQPLDGRSDIYSLGVVAYQCLTGGVPFDGEDSFSIGYKHIMEEIPMPPLENPEKRQLFEVIRKMMAKTPAQRFQSADELVTVLEGGRSVSLSTDATLAMPSLGGVRMSAAPTTPLPRATGTRPVGSGGAVPPTITGEPGGGAVTAAPRRSALAGVLLWLVIVGAVFGGGGFYAYKQGLIFAKAAPAHPDSTVARDTTKLAAADTTRRAADTSGDTASESPPPAPSTPGRLVLQNVPQGAQVSIDGQQMRGTQLDLSPGVRHLTVR